MPQIGYSPELQIAFAMAFNTGEQISGLNTTMGLVENLNLQKVTPCLALEALVRMAYPTYPAFQCEE